MKIVITALGKELTSKTDPKFGRAKYHLIYNLDNDEFEVINNEENMKRMGGAGIQAAENVVAKGAEFVLTGHCGPNAFKALEGHGVKVISGVQSTVGEAVDDFRNGKFETLDKPDVEGHWG